MTRPDFEAVAAKEFDGCLKKLFLDGLGYYTIEKDPDEKDLDRPDGWRMIVPIKDSLPFAVAYKKGLGGMERQGISKLYIDPVLRHRDGSPSVTPVLYGFGDGVRFVFFSADPARNRDDRFELSAATWEFRSVQDKFSRLHSDQLGFQSRLGRKRPLVDFLFEGHPLSADGRFKRYVHFVRQELMRAVLDERKALAAIVYHLLEPPEMRQQGKTHLVTKDGKLKKSLEDLHLDLGMRLGDAIGAAVDTLLLRYLMMRFLESYHPEAMDGLLRSKELFIQGKGGKKSAPAKKGTAATLTLFEKGGTAAATFTDVELELAERLTEPLGIDVSKAKKKAKGKDERQADLFVFEDEQTLAETVLSEEQKRKVKLGGDFYLADLGRAAQAVEETLLSHPKSNGAKLLEDFLGRTGAPEMAHWDFRYEDLRPQALQDYYESSLGTAVQLTWNERTKEFEVAVGKTERQRKELGAYYTDSRLCRFMVERTVKPLFEERLAMLRKMINARDHSGAAEAFKNLIGLSICDPTMGSAPFLRSAFDYLSEQYLPLCRVIAEAKSLLPSFFDDVSKGLPFLASRGGKMDEEGVGRWEWHILRRMLYGVDIDLKAVCIACQTFALSALKYLKQGERFPSFFNLNLKCGNPLISPLRAADRAKLAKERGKDLANLIRLRREAVMLPNTERAYERLALLLREIDSVKIPILRDLVQERVAPILQEFTDELRPFCWELEFPEVFFSDEGACLTLGGFDVMIGNPPWEEIDVDDDEFFGSLSIAYEDAKRDQRKTLREKLLKNSSVASTYAEARDKCDAISRFVNEGGWYEFQRLQRVDGRKGFTPQNNYFRMAAELFYKMSSLAGWVSIVAPHGIVGDEGVKSLRGLFFSSTRMQPVLAFKEKNDIFAHPQAFAVVSFQKDGSTDAVGLVDGLSEGAQLSDLPTAIPVPVETLKRCSPISWGLVAATSEMDLRILTKLHSFPSLADNEPQEWTVETGTEEINETRGYWMWSERPTEYVMRKGEFTEAFRIRSEVARYLKAKEFKGKAGRNCETWRIVWRDVINEDAERRMLWAVVPPRSGIGNSLNWIVPGLSKACAVYLICVMNSYVIEYRARQLSTNNHISKFIVKQLPWPRLVEGDVLFDEIVHRGIGLLGDFTKQPRDGESDYIIYPGMELSETRRCKLQDEIDARVALLFGLNRAEFEHVLASPKFHRVDDARKRSVLACFSASRST